MKIRSDFLIRNSMARYLFGIAAILIAFGIRVWLIPLTGTGAPFPLFFAATLVSTLVAGTGPGICAALLSAFFGAYIIVVHAGDPLREAAFQSLLFAVDGVVVVYVTRLMTRSREAVQEANRQLRKANEEIERAQALARELIELAPDAFFLADLDARFRDVNQAACRMLGYDRGELLGKTIFDIIPPEDVERLRKVQAKL